MSLAGTGLASGLLGALFLTRLMSSLLFGIRSTDPATFGAIAVLLTAVALFATYIPAKRAGRVDPMQCLRAE
jgi:ABC-type lipoprotein release transport system permease subunit